MSDTSSAGSPGPTQQLYFTDIDLPVVLEGCPELLPILRRVMPFWPVRMAEGTSDACIRVAPSASGKYRVSYETDGKAPSEWNAVNAVCEIIADLAWERLRSDETLFCLHGAAVVFAGRLVIFPNDHRAGKSTLTAVLGHQGRTIFGDDVLPIAIAPDGTIEGIATGVLPRIRLPVPPSFSPAFQTWAARNAAPGNAQYKYLDVPGLAAHGARLPIGAIVRLERKEAQTPMIRPLSAGEAFESVVDRNFARSHHTARILRTFDSLATQVRLASLVYDSAEEAAELLAREFLSWDTPPATVDLSFDRSAQPAEDGTEGPAYDPGQRYIRADGLTETTIDGQQYVADGDGRGLFRLNPGARIIWAVLEEPASGPEVAEIVSTVFPAEDPARIADDCARTVHDFLNNALIVPAA